MLKKSRLFLAAAVAAMSAPLVALAQTAPATPTTAVELAQSVDLTDAKAAALVIVGLLISMGVVLWGARLVQAKFKPKA